ncbi:GEF1 (YJR040W) [Zygosaccharomyces parabailii]|nr:GEF1 (YJR040W) [Zygosaccharomyces parabailii]
MPSSYSPNKRIYSGDRFKDIPETEKFDDFVTIDWLNEEHKLINGGRAEPDVVRNLRYQRFRRVIWSRCQTIVTLTAIAVTIGCIAGFLQIFTETLVNWKTGHCSRNWLLNKSFCCSGFAEANNNNGKRNSLSKREEFECVNNGVWTPWFSTPMPFLIFSALSVLFAILSTLLVRFVAPMATGSGISEIKVWVSGFKYRDDFLNATTLLVKSIALPLAISSGLSVGKEGPSVHYATCCAYVITNWLMKDVLTYSRQSEYLTAASGAGVAVAFGSPIGGVLFGLEEIASSVEFSASTLWKSFYVALGAVSTLEYINPFRSGKIVLFNVTYDRDWRVQEIPVYIILGIFGGLYGKYVSKWNINYVHFRKVYLSKWPVQEVVILAFITALISYTNEFLKLDMTESMGILFHECQSNDKTSSFTHRLCQLDENTHVVSFLRILSSLFAATFIRILLVVVSYGAKIPAGIFVPSMAVGATFGRAISLLVERFVSGPGVITGGAYAFLGAAATLCGITQLTLTVVVIMFELTDAFMYIIPTMIVVAITRIVMSNSGVPGGIADQMIQVNGFPLMESEDEDGFMEDHVAEEIMSQNLTTINEKITLSNLESMIYDSQTVLTSGFPIVKEDYGMRTEKKCIGYVLRRDIMSRLLVIESDTGGANRTIVDFGGSDSTLTVQSEGAQSLSFRDIVNSCPIFVKLGTPTSLIFRMFQQLGCKVIMVENDGMLQGLITRKDIMRFQRTQRREIYGPAYKFNPYLYQKLWFLVRSIMNKLKGSGG